MLGAETRATGRATRESLLQAAVDCIAELGCVASTTTRIAKRAGVSRGSLQHHFRSRDDLLLSVAERVFISDPAADVEALRAKPLHDRLDHLFDHVERATLNNRFAAAVRLAAALDHAHMLLFHPRDAAPEWLQRLVDAGWTTPAIVTLSQLVAFLSFQIRVVAGLRAMQHAA